MNRKDKRKMKRMTSITKRVRGEKGLEISRVDEGEGNNAVREKRNRRRGEEDELDEKVGRRE